MGTYGATWEYGGYNGCGNIHPIIDSLNGAYVIVAGNASGVFAEVEKTLKERPDALVFAVNDVGMYLPNVDHWLSLHYNSLLAWRAVRWLENTSHTYTHSIADGIGFDYSWHGLSPLFALSGYFAAQVAHIMGAGRIVLCGCPGDETPRFFEHSKRADNFQYGGGKSQYDKSIQTQLRNEMKRVPVFAEKIRSTSGWTAHYFGSP